MAAGRPTLYREEYCDQLIQHMRDGYSYESFGGTIEVSRAVLYDWEKVHQEFLDAKKKGIELGLLYWERKGRNCEEIKNFQPSVYIFTMKARFKWADQVVVKNEDEEEKLERIRKLSDSELVKLLQEKPEE